MNPVTKGIDPEGEALAAHSNSALLLAVRELVAAFLRQKQRTIVANVLALVPPVMQPLVLQAVDCLSAEGVIAVHGKAGGVVLVWRSTEDVQDRQ